MLNGKRIVVTGAAQGIGAALASGLAAMGGRIALADIDDPSAAAARITAKSGDAIAVTGDVASPDGCEAIADAAVAAFGGIDGLVCNAALFNALPLQPFDEIDEHLWDRVMQVNVKGPWLCVRAMAPHMRRAGGGSVVMISSNRIFRGFPDLLHYDASKGAVWSMTRGLIRELGPSNIRVNTIAPGLTMSEGVLAKEGIDARKGAIAGARSLARDQQPDDLIGPTAFFLSDHSGFVTGQTLVVDGGGVLH